MKKTLLILTALLSCNFALKAQGPMPLEYEFANRGQLMDVKPWRSISAAASTNWST